MKTQTATFRGLILPAMAALSLALAPPAAHSAIYVLFSGPQKGAADIKGEVTVEGFQNYVECGSMQWGVGAAYALSSRGTGAGFEVGRPSFSEIVLTKSADSTSPLYMKALALGGYYNTVTIAFARTSGPSKPETYMKIELKDVVVTGYSVSSGGDRPSESLSLNYSAIKYSYIPFDETGKPGTPVTSEWNVATNTGKFDASRQEPLSESSPPAVTGSKITVNP